MIDVGQQHLQQRAHVVHGARRQGCRRSPIDLLGDPLDEGGCTSTLLLDLSTQFVEEPEQASTEVVGIT
jgi:hypothetical protein